MVGGSNLRYGDQYWIGTVTNFTNIDTRLPHYCRFDKDFNIGQYRGSRGYGGCKERLKRDFTYLLNQRMRNITFVRPSTSYFEAPPFTTKWWQSGSYGPNPVPAILTSGCLHMSSDWPPGTTTDTTVVGLCFVKIGPQQGSSGAASCTTGGVYNSVIRTTDNWGQND